MRLKNNLTVWIFVGILLGAVSGIIFSTPAVPIFSLIGDLFLRLLKMVIVPLIFTSITSGVLSVGASRSLGRLTAKTIFYYLITSLLAILTGLFFVNLIRPGVNASLGFTATVLPESLKTGNWRELILHLVPENPIQAMAQGEILPLIFFSIFLGVAISNLPENYREPLARLFDAGAAAMLRLTHYVIYCAPVGVFGLVGKITATLGWQVFQSLGLYFLTVTIGLVVHFFITLPLLIRLLTHRSPYRHMQNMSPALLTAFTTASSSATLPLTLETAEIRAGISPKIASFVLPLGATINMDGTALYECVAAIFIAQVYGISLDLTTQLAVVVTALLASIGAAGIPMAGLVMMTIVLKAAGLPLEGIGLILAVDQLLDMLRTATNVWSDATCALIIASSEGELSPPSVSIEA